MRNSTFTWTKLGTDEKNISLWTVGLQNVNLYTCKFILVNSCVLFQFTHTCIMAATDAGLQELPLYNLNDKECNFVNGSCSYQTDQYTDIDFLHIPQTSPIPIFITLSHPPRQEAPLFTLRELLNPHPDQKIFGLQPRITLWLTLLVIVFIAKL